jgi:lactoylglutathione lyase
MKRIQIILMIAMGAFAQNNGQAQGSPRAAARLNHTAIYVVDLKKSGDFYTRIIGLDTVPEPFHDGKHIWLQTAPHIQMHIIQGSEKAKAYYKNQHSCFSVASVEDFAGMLTRENIPFEDRDGKPGAITTRIDGVKQIWLQDPDGYWVEMNDAKD